MTSTIQSFPEEPFEAQLQLMVGPGEVEPTIFDVGANGGLTARKYRAKVPAAIVYCFEPFADSVAGLEEVFAKDDRVRIVVKAAADGSGTAPFYVTHFDATHSLLPRFTAGRRYYPDWAGPKETIEVEAVALDDFVRDEGILTVDILKMDVQGGELPVLRGAQSLLRRAGVSLIYAEVMFVPHYEDSPLLNSIWSFLLDFGFPLFDIYDLHRAPNGQLRFADALFVSDEVRRLVIDIVTAP